MKSFNLATPFFLNGAKHPQRKALVIGDRSFTYGDLSSLIAPIAGWIRSKCGRGEARVGILASRCLEAYLGVLGSVWAGVAYVPLHPGFPATYLHRLMRTAELSALIVDPTTHGLLTGEMMSLCPGAALSPLSAPADLRGKEIQGAAHLRRVEPLDSPVPVAAGDLTYLMFTSGSTGEPKAVAVSAGNVRHFLEVTQERYRLREDDRFSQFNDLNWDPSVFDLFSAWEVGGSVHVIPKQQLLFSASFIRRHELTVWYSIPSQIELFSRMGMLREGNFPSLRLSLFVGEPLTDRAARMWQLAAPNSLIENVYGPTETTVVCAGQAYDGTPSCITPERGHVAIGKPYRGTNLAVLDSRQRFLPAGRTGELAISGAQVTPGYWKEPRLTEERFRPLVHPDLGEKVWYLTGDQAREGPGGIFHFLGRIDNQVKVLGKRVELEEVEFHLRRLSGRDEVCVLAWPVADGTAAGLAAFIGGGEIDAEKLRLSLKKSLPAYMVPQSIEAVSSMPRTRTGKTDRKKLFALLESRGDS